MKIEIITDAEREETKIVIYTKEVNDEVNRILTRLSDDAPKVLVGFKDDMAKLLEPSDVIRIFAFPLRASYFHTQNFPLSRSSFGRLSYCILSLPSGVCIFVASHCTCKNRLFDGMFCIFLICPSAISQKN